MKINHTGEFFEIKSRGRVYPVDVTKTEGLNYDKLKELMEQKEVVEIDNSFWVIAGIEYFAVAEERKREGKEFGLLVKPSKTFTGGDVIVEQIQVGDIHYEFEYGYYLEVEVLSRPVKQPNGPRWGWIAKDTTSGKEIKYVVHLDYCQSAPNLYTYIAYPGSKKLVRE